MKIAIEGMDGVGKSTIAKMVAQKYGYTYLEKPLTELLETSEIDGKKNLGGIAHNIYPQDEVIRAWFFGLGNLYTFIKYEDEDLVIDRHFASNYFWNGSDKTKEIFKTMINYISLPDITVVLYASPETRMRRIYNRNKNDYDLTDGEKRVDGYIKMINFLSEFNIPYVIVDTENKDIDDVFIEVDQIIAKKIDENKTRKLVKPCD